ncbi:NYN domain-containing protein [Actinocrispum wychmicini]|uniref:NYN domain-containing protein n=1 Tax=Actinocrispum wychmicini TaxID=1213861 RepID=A0A4R2JKY8_9PSEU|nr:NYN domain-containing protein [Actinocrispum wychmicini]TCO57259.1 NYN domain-containing protein [Actinocrispum wychmicini]
MRVGVYVDGYNLYYGGRKQCGRGTAGWRWLDLRALATALVAEQGHIWPGAQVDRVVYCTARINSTFNAGGALDQNVYLDALCAANSVDHIEFGNYISKVIARPLAIANRRNRPVLTTPAWPIIVQQQDVPIPDATFIASVATWEEKGSDVNVASHLLVDVVSGAVDAALVISNDSDLKMPVREVRERVPLGVVNPGGGYTARALSGDSTDGVGRHWWRALRAADFRARQLPDPVEKYRKPFDW